MEVGIKDDAKKPMWALLPFTAVDQVVQVLTFGANKYAPNNWRLVENYKVRYISAAYRHLYSWCTGNTYDEETGLHHLAHAVVSLLFIIEKELDETKTEELECGF